MKTAARGGGAFAVLLRNNYWRTTPLPNSLSQSHGVCLWNAFQRFLIPSSFLYSNTVLTKGPCDCLLINLAECIHIGSLNAYQC